MRSAIPLFFCPLYGPPTFRSAVWRQALDRPETLLKSALEKVVFFECRLDQLNSELQTAHQEVERLKADLASAAQRELALRQELAASEAKAAQASRERADAQGRIVAAHAERERLLGKLIEAERIRQAGQAVESLDLAAFIAELRSEVIALREGRDAAAAEAQQPQRFESTADAAQALADQGRIGLSVVDREALRTAAKFATRSEETLFALSLRELTSRDAPSRLRAAQRLKTLAPRASLPAIAAALNAEQQPEVICGLLEVIGAAGDASALPLVSGQLGSTHEEVRLAALEAALALGDATSLDRALCDASARVRRRATVLAASNPSRLAPLERAAVDLDPSVRRVAALSLAACAGPRARALLLGALDDVDPTVRRAAAKGLSRSLGPEVFELAELDSARRKRELRRLAAEPERPESFASQPAPAAASEPEAPQPDPRALEQEVLSRIYGALRGQSADDLARGVGAPAEVVLACASGLERQGRLVRRGQRYYVP